MTRWLPVAGLLVIGLAGLLGAGLALMGAGVAAQGVAPAPVELGPPAPALSASEHVAASRSYRIDWIILGAACLGAFLSQRADPLASTWSLATVYWVLITGGATYLTLQSGVVPDSLFKAAVTNPVQTGVVAFVAAGLGGGGLVKGTQVLLGAAIKAKLPGE